MVTSPQNIWRNTWPFPCAPRGADSLFSTEIMLALRPLMEAVSNPPSWQQGFRLSSVWNIAVILATEERPILLNLIFSQQNDYNRQINRMKPFKFCSLRTILDSKYYYFNFKTHKKNQHRLNTPAWKLGRAMYLKE